MRFDQLKRCIESQLHLLDPEFRADANESVVFARALEYVYAEAYNVEYPENKARLLIPVDSRPGPGARSHTYNQYDEIGEAKIVDDYGDDFPSAEVKGQQYTGPIVSIGESYSYSIQDLRSAQMAGYQLESEKALTARRVMERKLDALACTGDSATGLKGLANATGIAAATKISAGAWSASTADEIRADVDSAWSKVFDGTKGIHLANTIALPTSAYSTIATKRLDNFNNMTVLQYILQNNPSIRSIEFWNRLDTAGSGNGTRMLCYDRTPSVCSLVIPQEFEQFAPQVRNMAFKTACHMRFAGVKVPYPKAVAYIDGV